jgi:hypothetical protein
MSNVFNQLTSKLFNQVGIAARKYSEATKHIHTEGSIIVSPKQQDTLLEKFIQPQISGQIAAYRNEFAGLSTDLNRKLQDKIANFTDDYSVRQAIQEQAQKIAPEVMANLFEGSTKIKDLQAQLAELRNFNEVLAHKNKRLAKENFNLNDQLASQQKKVNDTLASCKAQVQGEIQKLRDIEQVTPVQPIFDPSSIEAMVREQVEQARASLQDDIQKQVNSILEAQRFQIGGITEPEYIDNNYNFEAKAVVRKKAIEYNRQVQAENAKESEAKQFLKKIQPLTRIGDCSFTKADIERETGIDFEILSDKVQELCDLGLISKKLGTHNRYTVTPLSN